MEAIKRNITLIVGLCIPLAMILFVAGSIYIPSLFANPQYDFLYAAGGDYYYADREYVVENERLVKRDIPSLKPVGYELPRIAPKLYVHETAGNTNKEITFADAQALSLNSDTKSPDGFEVVSGNNRGGGIFPELFFGGGRGGDVRYLEGHGATQKLDLKENGSYWNFRFLGWIKK